MIRQQAGERVQKQLPILRHAGECRPARPARQRRISAYELLRAVAIALAIAVLVGAVLRGDPGPCLGVCDAQPQAGHDSQSPATPVPSHTP